MSEIKYYYYYYYYMIQQSNIQLYFFRLNAIIVTEITLGHNYRWHATTSIDITVSHNPTGWPAVLFCVFF